MKLIYIQRFICFFALSSPFVALADAESQAKRIHERVTGVAPSETVLNSMAQSITDDGDGIAAAITAMNNDNFYRVTIKNWAAPWTNRDQSVFVDLNDYIATVMGYIRDDYDFRGILYDDKAYTFSGISPAFSNTDNSHYENAEASDPQTYLFKDNLAENFQSDLNNLPADATAGIMTSRAAAEAFFVDGTNRAMFRYTLMNHMCMDLEELQDPTLPPDRIRQDVSRSPGGDSRAFSNGCVTCHAGMDPLAQAFAYYDFENDYMDENGNDIAGSQSIIYNTGNEINEKTGDLLTIIDVVTGDEINTRTQGKYHINSTTFSPGFITTDASWVNYWRGTQNDYLGWNDGSLNAGGSGEGAKSLGMELAYSDQFAQCQVEKVFEAMCLREPNSAADITAVEGFVSNFTNNGYRLKQVFAETVDYCTAGL